MQNSKTVQDTVLIWESESVPTLHRVIDRVYSLNENLKKIIFRKNYRPAVQFAENLKRNLNRRYPDNGADNKFRRLANYQYWPPSTKACT